MKLIKEFKDFAIKGNMMDMAIGIIIGASFNKVLDVLVKKIILPPLTFLSSGVKLGDKKYVIDNDNKFANEYGLLLETCVDFLIIGLTLFIIVKIMNRIRNKAEDVNDKTVQTPKNIELLSNIDNSLKELLKNNYEKR